MHGEHSWIGHSLEHSQVGQELSNIFRISVFSILNTLKNCAKLYQCANIAQDKRWHCAILRQRKKFFLAKWVYCAGANLAMLAQNTIAPYFNKLINIIKKKLFSQIKK